MLDLLSTHPLVVYFMLVAGIIILPGMDMAFVLASALSQGRRAGLAAVAGLVCGGIAHIALAGAGLGLLLTTVPALAQVMLLGGMAYLGWIGLTLWRHGATLDTSNTRTQRSQAATMGQALLTCLLNPKAYLFMLAVFPRFIHADNGPWLQQVLPLGLITATTQTVVYGAVALGAARVRATLARDLNAQRLLGRSVGLLLMACATWAVLTGWRI